MAIKLDLAKAYDHVDWRFLRETMLEFRFSDNLFALIMFCIIDASLYIVWNGQ